MTYNMQALEDLIRNNRRENAAHKAALGKQLFGAIPLSEADTELCDDELAMAAGGLKTEFGKTADEH